MDHTSETPEDAKSHTPWRKFRVPPLFWEAYGNVCKQLGTNRTEDLLAHMRQQINRHGAEADLDLLAAADAEQAERHARKGGRPRKTDAGG